MANRWVSSGRLYFGGAQKSVQMVTAMKLRHLLLGRKAMANPDSIKRQRHYFANKSLSS